MTERNIVKTIAEVQKFYGQKLAKAALSLGAIRLTPAKPFTWASGYHMPIYNDNRLFLAVPEDRMLICYAFADMIDALNLGDVDNISGTATAGIPHAVTLADKLRKPTSYVRSSAKDHGMGNQIEGLAGGSFQGKRVLLIEDLISTGSSSIKALEVIRRADGICDTCLAIFTYGLNKASEAFGALNPKCSVYTILDYDVMLKTARADGYISEEDAESLRQWRESPFEWGEKHGFPRQS